MGGEDVGPKVGGRVGDSWRLMDGMILRFSFAMPFSSPGGSAFTLTPGL